MHDREPERITGEALQKLLAMRAEFLAFVERRVDSPAVAEDILQNAFVRGIEKGGSIRDEESTVAWFYRMLRNAVIDYFRRKHTGDRALEKWARELEGCDVPQEFEKNEVCRCVGRLLEELKPEYKEALRLVDLENCNLRELAQRSGISENNAAVRVHRARRALMKHVTLTCGVCATHGCIDCRCGSKGQHYTKHVV
jgi:RNA polymerase sigma-70 factor (ECF subfamily)